MYTNKQCKALLEKINNLSSTEHSEILKIIKQNDTPYTQNKNGIFFNLSTLKDETVKDIESFVVYCMSNKRELDEYDKLLNECKINNNINIMSINTSVEELMRKPKVEKTWSNLESSYEKTDNTFDNFYKFVDRVSQDKEKIYKKKLNIKFNNAKKRYSRKIVDKKFDIDQTDHLRLEEYIV